MLQRNAFPTSNTALRLRTGLQAGALSAALALVGAAGLAASAMAASGMATAQVVAPVTITVQFSTDLLAFDLAWSNHTDAARQAVADQIVSNMDNPAAPYIIELRQLPAAWRPLAADFATTSTGADTPNGARRRATSAPVTTGALYDMNGAMIDRNKARLGRLNYERDIEAALLDILQRVRAQRPGALISIENFVPPESFGARAGSYKELLKALDFVVMQMPTVIGQPTASATGLSRRSRGNSNSTSSMDFDRIFQIAGAPDNMWVLVQQNGVWTAVDDDPLPAVLEEGADAADSDWSSDGGSSNDAPAAPDNGSEPGDAGDGEDSAQTPPPVVIEPDQPTSDDAGDDPDVDPVDQNFGSDGEGDSGEPDVPQDNPGGDDQPGDDMGDDAEPGPTDDLPDPPADDDDETPPPPPSDDDDDDTVTNPGGGVDAPPSDDDTGADDQPDDPPADDMPDDEPNEPDINTGAAPLLIPGAGFVGLTAQPAPIGSGPGSDATAIARWDVVPYQTFEDEFPIGVVAFHINGIDRVEFSVDGGPWASVYEMSLNPRTGVWEYVAMLDADEFDDDGMVEVRAVAYPNAGIPRVLAGPINMGLNDARIRGEYSMFLNANAGGTLQEPVRWVAPSGNDDTGDGTANKPFATIAKAAGDIQDDHGVADGGLIYLKPGNYEYGQTSFGSIPQTSERWLTIAGAPGQAREAARITSNNGNGLRTKLVKFENLTIFSTSPAAGGQNNFNSVWTNNALLEGEGPLDGISIIRGASWTGGAYSTNTEYRQSLRAARELTLIRDPYIHHIGGDAFRELRGLAINVRIHDLLNLDGTHNDVMQFFSNAGYDTFENIIIYGLEAVQNVGGQALFVSTNTAENGMHRDWAIVNYMTNAQGGGGAQWQDLADHLLLWNVSILNQGFVIRDSGQPTTITNLSVRNSVFNLFRMSHTGNWPTMANQSWARDNHFIDMESFQALAPGQGATTGGEYSALFVNPASNDFRPKPGSVIANRISNPLTPAGLNGIPFGSPGPVGAAAPPQSP